MKPAPYGPFPYSAINRRPKWTLPDGARVALWIIPNIEFFPLDRGMPADSNSAPRAMPARPWCDTGRSATTATASACSA